MLDFASGFHILYLAVAVFLAGLFLVVDLVLIWRKTYLRRGADIAYYTASCVIFAALILVGAFGIITKTAVFGLHFRPQGTNLFITLGTKGLSIPHLGSLYTVFETVMGWVLYGAVTATALAELIIHPIKAKSRKKFKTHAGAADLPSAAGEHPVSDAQESLDVYAQESENVSAQESQDVPAQESQDVPAEDSAEEAVSPQPAEPVISDKTPDGPEAIAARQADVPLTTPPDQGILDKKTAAEVMNEIDKLVDFAGFSNRNEEQPQAETELKPDIASEPEPDTEPETEPELDIETEPDTESEPQFQIKQEPERKAGKEPEFEPEVSEQEKVAAGVSPAEEKPAAREYPPLTVKTIIRRPIVIPSPYKTAAAETAAAKQTPSSKPAAEEKTLATEQRAPAQAERAAKAGPGKSAAKKSKKKPAPAGPIEVEEIEIHPGEAPDRPEETPTGDAKVVRPIETELPVTKRYVILNRRNVVNMFSEYLQSKDTEDKEKLTNSINTIIYK